ncbi:MAG: PilT/PilU family type 4a pilus ATPase [Clostridia bacterium]|nr:PilT/PilU family type 4a pilus ATPase [Clostridia bacterium]
MVSMQELLKRADEEGASDLHLCVGIPPKMRIDGKLKNMRYDELQPSDTLEMLIEVLTTEQREHFDQKGEIDLSFSIRGQGRYRMTAYKQRGTVAMAVRLMEKDLIEAEKIGVPAAFLKLHHIKSGLILATGPSGSGISTTVATLIDRINQNEESLIITLENPIEYLHEHKKGIVNQREIGFDTTDYVSALRNVLREDPDVIYIGTVLEYETMKIALAAAEAGCLVIGTLHTLGAVHTLKHIIHSFPLEEQEKIRIQLVNSLTAIVSQQLVPLKHKHGRIPAFEVMLTNATIRKAINENQIEAINDLIPQYETEGMCLMDDSLIKLYHNDQITAGYTVRYADDKNRVLAAIGEVEDFT